ncbi:hypothetical protein OG405_09895 [Nocardia sp. NBC_01329]|nr:hypothetical protein OG405_09895 [Nocardia sp. NBC_01329]
MFVQAEEEAAVVEFPQWKAVAADLLAPFAEAVVFAFAQRKQWVELNASRVLVIPGPPLPTVSPPNSRRKSSAAE